MPLLTPSGLLLPESQGYNQDPGGSLTWLKRLEKQLAWRNSRISVFDNYYRGKHRLQFATPKFNQTFGGLFHEFADNWTPLVVDAVVERLNPVGFRMGTDSDKGDKAAQYMWQANNMDSEVKLGMFEAILREEAYLLVWNDPDTDFVVPDTNESVPSITVEDPSQCIVAYSSSSRRKRAAGAKFFVDDDGYPCATVYLPDYVYKYRSQTRDYRATDDYQVQAEYLNAQPAGGGSQTITLPDTFAGNLTALDAFGSSMYNWQPRYEADEPWPLENTLGVVPIIPIRNNARLLGPGSSEIVNVIPMQDAANKFMTDMLIASEYAAFPQRWGVGIDDVPAGYGSGPGSMMWTKNQDAKFGVFPEMTATAHIKAIETVVQHIASQTRTPPHYFYLSGHFPSGDAIKSAEAGLVAKVRDKMVGFGEAFEEAIRLCFKMIGDPRAREVDSETMWRDPESRTEGQHIDAVVKKLAIGVPLRQLQEDAGYTPAQIDRFASMREEEIIAWVLASRQAMLAMAAMGVPDPNAAVTAASNDPNAPAPTAAPGYPTGLPNPTGSGAKEALIQVPGADLALDTRSARVTV